MWLTLFKEIFAVHSENQTEPINTYKMQELLNVKEAGTYNYHSALKGATTIFIFFIPCTIRIT
jgi:hypothetical protein